MSTKIQACEHLPAEQAVPQGTSCPKCGSAHSLRVCSTCGYVACCESQFGHNKEHWKESGHPVIRPYPLSESGWTWCYGCGRYL
jgi:CPA1 family monovalent cation:H+ antiporter